MASDAEKKIKELFTVKRMRKKTAKRSKEKKKKKTSKLKVKKNRREVCIKKVYAVWEERE